MPAKPDRRKKPVVRAVCSQCGLRLVGELRADGKLYATRHPETVQGEPIPIICHCCGS